MVENDLDTLEANTNRSETYIKKTVICKTIHFTILNYLRFLPFGERGSDRPIGFSFYLIHLVARVYAAV